MTLDGAAIRAGLAAVGAVGGQMRSYDELAAGANGALRSAPPGLTPAGAASFLATMAQESAYFRTTEEYGNDTKWYDPYRGRTFEQVTHEGNYRAFGAWCKARGLIKNDPNQFVADPPWLADYRWAWLGGVWYFEVHNLWAYANRGDHYSVSQGVNRGVGAIGSNKAPLHWTERKKMFDAFVRVGVMPDSWEEDDMPSAREVADAILDTPITRQGTAIPQELRGGKTSLRNEIAWLTNAMIHSPWSAPGAGDRVARAVDALGASDASAPDELRALRAQLSDVETRLTDALNRATAQAGTRPSPVYGDPAGAPVDLAAELRAALGQLGPLLVTLDSAQTGGLPR